MRSSVEVAVQVLMDQSLVLETEISRGIVEGSVAVVNAQKSPEGFTIYRVTFKVKVRACCDLCLRLEVA